MPEGDTATASATSEPMDEDTTTAEPSFALSRVLTGHKADVRGLSVNADGVLISGGRDETVRLWSRRAADYTEQVSYAAEQQVTSVAFFEGTTGDWRIFAGRRNGSIAVFGSGQTAPLTTVHGHKGNVSCLHVNEETGELLSGAWDNHVIVWPILLIDQKEEKTLSGHTLSVWAVSGVPERRGFYLSGAADKEIFLWEGEKIIRKFKGHKDVVRALQTLPASAFFLSAGNDAAVRLWNLDNGECLATITALNEEYIYSLSYSAPYLVAAQEGGHLEIWKLSDKSSTADGIQHYQTVASPATSLWAAVIVPNGDVAAAGSDGRIYVYTRDERRLADRELQESINEELAARVAKAIEAKEQQMNEVVVIKVSIDDSAPNMELRYVKGDDPSIAAEQFIRDNQLPISYLNDVVDYIVKNIPEAKAAQQKKYHKQATQKAVVDGKEYDYAFEVTLEDGRKATLTYNVGDDVDYSAQQFLEKYNLPIKFLPKVSSLLRTQISEQTSGPSSDYYDPFTGGGRYVPQSSNGAGFSGVSDPLTGGGRYVPASANPSANGAVAGDPLTYIPGSADASGFVPNSTLPQDKRRPRSLLVPIKDYYVFGVEQVSAKALEKLREVNDAQEALKLAPSQLGEVEKILKTGPSDSFTPSDSVAAALDLGLQWPIACLVPVLDAFRVALLHSKLNNHYCQGARGVETRTRLLALLASEPAEPIRILTCRALANAFTQPAGREMLMNDLAALLPHIVREFVQGKNALQLAAASALGNYALTFLRRSEVEKVEEIGPREDCLREILKQLENVDSFGGRSEQALIRILQTIVTLMWGDSSAISVAKNRNAVTIVNRIKDAVVEEDGKAVARDIVEMTYAI